MVSYSNCRRKTYAFIADEQALLFPVAEFDDGYAGCTERLDLIGSEVFSCNAVHLALIYLPTFG